VLELALLTRAAPSGVVAACLLGVAEDATIAASTGGPLEVAAELGLHNSLLLSMFSLLPVVVGRRVVGGASLGVAGLFALVACVLGADRGQGELRLKLVVIGSVAQFLRPLPPMGRLRKQEGMVAVELGAGTFHFHTLRPPKCGGELGHQGLAEGFSAVHAEAKGLGVVNHTCEEFICESANSGG